MRGVAPWLFSSAFTKQAVDHLEQVETFRKLKGKGKKIFSRPQTGKVAFQGPRQAKWQVEQAVQITRTPSAIQGTNWINSKETEMTIRCRAEGSSRHAHDFKYKCQSYKAETACCGVFHSSKTAKQSPSGRQT